MNKLLLLVVLCLNLTACTTLNSSLTYGSFSNFRIDELSTKPVTLRLTGLSMNSALVISEIRQVYNEESLDIDVVGRLVGDSRYGVADLNFVVVVPDYVSEVRFGAEKKVVWKRALNK